MRKIGARHRELDVGLTIGEANAKNQTPPYRVGDQVGYDITGDYQGVPRLKITGPKKLAEYGEAFLAELYLRSGIRIGENMLTPPQQQRGIRMFRIAIPTRMYSLSDMADVASHLSSAWANAEKRMGLKKVSQPPSRSGALFSRYEPIVS